MKDEKLSDFWLELKEWCDNEVLRMKELSKKSFRNYKLSLKKELKEMKK